MSEQTPPEPKKYLRVNVRGKKPSVWKSMRKELVKQVRGLLATVVNPATGATVGGEVRGLAASAFDFLAARLDRPGLENAELEARVDYLYAQAAAVRVKSESEARESAARAEAQEIRNAFGKLRLILEAAKLAARLSRDEGEEGDEVLCFVRDLDAYQALLQAAADAVAVGEPPAPPKVG
jgi:hypothetical protein